MSAGTRTAARVNSIDHHVEKFYHDDPLRFPMSFFWHFMASALCEVASAVLCHHWPNFRSVFLKFGCIGDDVLSDQVSWHLHPPSTVQVIFNLLQLTVSIAAQMVLTQSGHGLTYWRDHERRVCAR